MRRSVAGLISVLAITACSGGSSVGPVAQPSSPATPTSSPAPSARTSPAAFPAWPTYHGTNDRAGDSPAAALQPPLRRAWAAKLDGALYAQPIVADGFVIAATEHDTVYALAPTSGRVIWRSHLGSAEPQSDLPCGNIDPLGITGTPAYDATTDTVFVVTETTGAVHTLVALDARTGKTRWHRNLDVLSNRDKHAEQQRPALLVANGRVYAAFGGLDGDCSNYVGYITGVVTDGSGPTLHYAIPTAREGGMWEGGGPAIGPGGAIYIADGNGAETGGSYDGSDSVVRLSATLQRTALFAPTVWRQDNAQDLDLGSMSPAPVGDRIVIAGKRGTVYLLPSSLGGIGGQLATLGGCAGYGGAAVHAQTVVLPCSDGIRAAAVGDASMHWTWSSSITGSPAIAGDVVYSPDTSSGDLVELSLASGHVLGRLHVGAVTRFATPAPVGRYVLVGTTDGVVAVTG